MCRPAEPLKRAERPRERFHGSGLGEEHFRVFNPAGSKAFRPCGNWRSTCIDSECFSGHRVDHVNCSDLSRRHGNFHLGRLPERRLQLELPAAPSEINPSGVREWRRAAFAQRHIQMVASVLLCHCRCAAVSLTLRTLLASSASSLTAWDGLPESLDRGRFRILEARFRTCKCLWK